MIQFFLFVRTSFLGEAALTTDAATIRWTNAGRRPPVRCASRTRITPVRRGRRERTRGVIIAEPSQDRPRTQRSGLTRHLSRRPPGLHHIINMNLIMVLPKVTRLAKNNDFSKVSDEISRHTLPETSQ